MENKKTILPEWLKKTQQNSWEPEIFISGIVLFGLLQVPEYLNEFRFYFKREIFGISSDIDTLVAILITGLQWLTFGLILHLFFRGIWIGLVGLSYVFPKGIRRENLNYQNKFKHKINTIPDFTNQIIRLEKISSSIFSISYFLFMSILGGYIFFVATIAAPIYLFFYLGPYDFNDAINSPALRKAVNIYVMVILSLGAIHMFDFLSLGLLKQSKYLARVYYPFHRAVSWLTLSTLYRNIYYILISNFRKWKVVVFIVCFIILTFIVATFHVNNSSVGYQLSQLEFYGISNGNVVSSSAYDNLNSGPKNQRASIQSDIIKDDVLRLFITHYSYYDDSVKTLCDFKTLDNKYSMDSLKLVCVSNFYKIHIGDSVYQNLTWKFHSKSNNKHRGIITYINISNLDTGLHDLHIELANWFNSNYQLIQFYKE